MSTRKQQQALDALLALIAQGVEYPEAEWRASKQGTLVDCSILCAMYDAHCAEQDAARVAAQRAAWATECDAIERAEAARLARAGIFI